MSYVKQMQRSLLLWRLWLNAKFITPALVRLRGLRPLRNCICRQSGSKQQAANNNLHFSHALLLIGMVAVEVHDVQGSGRGLVAVTPIAAGELVLRESPVLLSVNQELHNVVCAHCLRYIQGLLV